jgi:hypothetical protein
VRGQQGVDVRDLQAGQSSEHVGQVRLRIDPASAATDQQRVDDGTAPACVRVPDEEPPLPPTAVGRMSFSNQGMPHPEICRVGALGIDFRAVMDPINLRDAA